uniref:Glutathione peroxidase n=1 Tax=Dunaliella tertiolecta TaxID=3047 RepID=A0A7S3VSB7_DUNTE
MEKRICRQWNTHDINEGKLGQSFLRPTVIRNAVVLTCGSSFLINPSSPEFHVATQFLKAKLPKQKGGGSDIGWNFFKFIIDKRGNPTRLFPQTYDVARVEQEVYRLLTLPL